jgi:hypothetical protein
VRGGKNHRILEEIRLVTSAPAKYEWFFRGLLVILQRNPTRCLGNLELEVWKLVWSFGV